MKRRVRLRRQLLVLSAPVVVVALVAAYKLMSVVIVGNAAVSDFAHHDTDGLRGDVAVLSFLNVIEPDNARLAAADLAALEGRLAEADSGFSDVLSRTDVSQSCPVRINVELVRETQGDLAAREGNTDLAEDRYRNALAVVETAPPDCFEGNADPDNERRAIRHDAAPRLMRKIEALRAPQQSAPSPTPAAPPPPPPPPPPPVDVSAALGDIDADRLPGAAPGPALRLDPGVGHPLDRLQEALGNSAASAPS